MDEQDRKSFQQARPYLVGVVALAFRLRNPEPVGPATYFDEAERFIAEFEARYAQPDPAPQS